MLKGYPLSKQNLKQESKSHFQSLFTQHYQDHRNHMHITSVKMEIPKFHGTDALGCIVKTNHNFNFHNTHEEQRISIASFYMDNSTLNSYQWMYKNTQVTSWHNFLQALEQRFAPSQFEDPQGTLKLTQTFLVRGYQFRSKSLFARVIELPHNFLLSYFIPGLQPQIRREVQVL